VSLRVYGGRARLRALPGSSRWPPGGVHDLRPVGDCASSSSYSKPPRAPVEVDVRLVLLVPLVSVGAPTRSTTSGGGGAFPFFFHLDAIAQSADAREAREAMRCARIRPRATQALAVFRAPARAVKIELPPLPLTHTSLTALSHFSKFDAAHRTLLHAPNRCVGFWERGLGAGVGAVGLTACDLRMKAVDQLCTLLRS
jgi:hypothetical protein